MLGKLLAAVMLRCDSQQLLALENQLDGSFAKGRLDKGRFTAELDAPGFVHAHADGTAFP